MRLASIFVGTTIGIYLAYVGVYLLLMGGIVILVDGVKADPTNSIKIVWGIVEFILGALISYFSSVFLLIGIGNLFKKY